MKPIPKGSIPGSKTSLSIVLMCMASTAMMYAPGIQAQATASCTDAITANVVVLDSPTVFNRLGAQNPNWITYALERDVVDKSTQVPCSMTTCTAGNVELRPDKRPRPLVMRSVAGSCLTVKFTNLLAPQAAPNNAQQGQDAPGAPPGFKGLFNDDQVAGRCAGFHATGTELVDDIASDGSMVGANPGANIGDSTNGPSAAVCGPGLAEPGGTRTYSLFTPHEGAFVINSYGAVLGSEQSSGNLGVGMFGVLNVQPVGSKMYRSIATEEEMRLATLGKTPAGQPIIDYEATYPATNADGSPSVWAEEGKGGLPVLNMLTPAGELVHTDINAIIIGPNADGSFPNSTYPLESAGKNVPSLPTRLEPFREFTSVFHDEQANSQVFPLWYSNPVLNYTLAGVKDQFMINYGSGGIGSEIIANRLHTGPMHDCAGCAYEEFFLASQTVGDPGMLVNFPANTGIEACDPTNILTPSCWRQFAEDVTPDDGIDNPIAIGANPPIPGNFALFQEDPSNVHHSYVGDAVKIRNTHVGAFEQHIFHLHNHQWLFNPNDDNSNYLDAQEIMPGSGHTYELANGGAGNRNKTAGDAIFHCHFYPHFAQGMWYHIRIQDTFERGTVLDVSGADDAQNPTTGFHTTRWALRSGKPAKGARALPDAELLDGSPIPAIVPMPGKAMPEMPAKVSLIEIDRGDFGVLSGRRAPNGLLQGPDSSQAVVDFDSLNPDGLPDTGDEKSPGYPFWAAGNNCGIATPEDPCPEGNVGQRMPTPPLDMLTEAGARANGMPDGAAGGWDGGLPRHALRGYTSGGVSLDTQNRLDFRKVIEIAQPVYFPETGTILEKVAMEKHAKRVNPSYANTLSGTAIPADFILNGAPALPGGPFQDPCIDDDGKMLTAGVVGNWFDGDNNPATHSNTGSSLFTSENPRVYRVANVQIDAVFNKVGWHYPQERIIALWGDVEATINKQRPPEPLVMRFNTYDCGKILHTNLVPSEFELDDYQVRTPTDIIGQHIHLPKWDLTTNDGAANGWNYEDGALSPHMVVERVAAINRFNALAGQEPRGLVDLLVNVVGVDPNKLPGGLADAVAGHIVDLQDLAPVPTIETGDPGSEVHAGSTVLHALPHPYFGSGPGPDCTDPKVHGDYCGARTVIQRVLMDPLHNAAGVDRGLGLTFSHDHYGPSSFQQIGLYSTILAEPAGSNWKHNESGVQIGAKADGKTFGRTIAATDCTVNCTDGGPTTWQAIIDTPAGSDVPDHREFYFEMSDFQHAYEPGVYVGADDKGRMVRSEVVQPQFADVTTAFAPELQARQTWLDAINPPLKIKSVPFPSVVTAEAACPGAAGNADANVPRPCAEAINISHSSMFVVNYRNEPVGLRVFDPNAIGPDGYKGTQTAGKAGDLAFALQSRTDRAIPQLNTSFGDSPYPQADYCQGNDGDGINCDRNPGDPFTPIMRAYEGDQVKIKIQVGATEEQHQMTIHGMKWLSNGSGFGRAPNSGWRNFQSHGISEQFSLQVPINADLRQVGNTVDYLYATDATRDGFWTGSWGVLRSYGQNRQDLVELPDNPRNDSRIVNRGDFNGVCPKTANLVEFDVTAVLANDVLPNNLGVTIPANINPTDNVGGPMDPAGGTLVYNRRGTMIADVTIVDEATGELTVIPGGEGPIHDPTAMMYMMTDELVFDTACIDVETGSTAACKTALGDPVSVKPGVPVEPLVLRANAGDCIQTTLRNAIPEVAPDLAGWQDMMWIMKRRVQVDPVTGLPEMHFFQNNLIRPSSHVGLHSQLVEVDSSRDDGVLVGGNSEAQQIVAPGGERTYRWYAGDLTHKVVGQTAARRNRPAQDLIEIVATPVEYGASNLLSADRVKQPQKGMFGALSILPAGSTVDATTQVSDGQGSGNATRLTRAQATVTAPVGAAGSGGVFRENLLIGHKTGNMRWKDGSAIMNLHQGELGREGAEDSGHAGFNYGMEPSWFRFGLVPDAPFGNHGTPNSFGAIPNQQAMYANLLTVGEPNAVPAIAGVSEAGDPATPVFRATAGQATRIHVLNGGSADRDGTFVLHGHVWQRDPFVCPLDAKYGITGLCADGPDAVASTALGVNPVGKYMGGEEGMGHTYSHWPILFNAGGSFEVTGDYLFRDYSPSGNRNGQFGILRVE